MTNYRAVQESLGVTDAELATLAKNSFTYSFLPEEEISAFLQEVAAYCAQHGVAV